MSAQAVRQNIQNALANDRLTNDEVDTILDRSTPWFHANPSIGKNVDADEYAAISSLREQVAKGAVQADDGVQARLDQFLASEKPYDKVENAVKEGATYGALFAGIDLIGGKGIKRAAKSAISWGAGIGLLTYAAPSD